MNQTLEKNSYLLFNWGKNQQKQSQLRSEINELKQKPDKTFSKEQELVDKKNRLAELEDELSKLEVERQKNQSSSSETNQPSDKPWDLIIKGSVIGMGLVVFLATVMLKKRKVRKY